MLWPLHGSWRAPSRFRRDPAGAWLHRLLLSLQRAGVGLTQWPMFLLVHAIRLGTARGKLFGVVHVYRNRRFPGQQDHGRQAEFRGGLAASTAGRCPGRNGTGVGCTVSRVILRMQLARSQKFLDGEFAAKQG